MTVTWNCQRNFRRFSDFSSFEHQFALFSVPFIFDVAKTEESLQMKLLEIQLNSTLRPKYLEVGISGFFSHLSENFKNFKGLLQRSWQCCVWKQLLSFMKSKDQRTRLTDQYWNCTDIGPHNTCKHIAPKEPSVWQACSR